MALKDFCFKISKVFFCKKTFKLYKTLLKQSLNNYFNNVFAKSFYFNNVFAKSFIFLNNIVLGLSMPNSLYKFISFVLLSVYDKSASLKNSFSSIIVIETHVCELYLL